MHKDIEYVPERSEQELREMFDLPEQALGSNAPVVEDDDALLNTSDEINVFVEGLEIKIAHRLLSGQPVSSELWSMHQGTADRSLTQVNEFLNQELNNNS